MYKNNYKSKNDKPRNETIEFPYVPEFISRNGTKLDANQIYGILKDLSADGVFNTISTYVQMDRKVLLSDPEKKGFMNVGFIKEVNDEAKTVAITIYGNQVATIKSLLEEKQLYFSPKIISDRNGDFGIFTNFNLEVGE